MDNTILMVLDVPQMEAVDYSVREVEDRITNMILAQNIDMVCMRTFYAYESSVKKNDIPLLKLHATRTQSLYMRVSLPARENLNVQHKTYLDDELIHHIRFWNGGRTPKHVFLAGLDTDCGISIVAHNLWDMYRIKPVVMTKYCASTGGVERSETALAELAKTLPKNCIAGGFVESENIFEEFKRKR